MGLSGATRLVRLSRALDSPEPPALFWRKPAAALGIVRSLLAPGGSLSLIGQQPGWDAVAARAFAAWLGDVLGTQGFAVDEVLVGDIEPSPAVCVRARPV